MRLLHRDSTGSVSFTKDLLDDELPPYAILSHTWGADEEEVTYADILAKGGSERAGWAKIRFCIQRIQEDNLEHFWIDTCCINKKDGPELGSSLRSMFRWYANAKKCYVYLSGLETGREWKKGFRKHRWFQRGWTLQELIAPTNVEFFTENGERLGTKQSLEQTINEITHIPIPALRGQPLNSFSMMERKRWQAARRTRVPEDLVYSLLGIFDVSMTIMYGETAAKAWERLDATITIERKGIKHEEFSLAFSLADAAVETQHFVAREAELQEIHRNLSSDGRRKAVILHGLGGIGKTQLAMRYANRHRDDYTALLWLNAKDETSARFSFVSMAKQILREHPDDIRLSSAEVATDLDATIEAVKAWLSMPLNTRWLLICDNYDNPRVPGNLDTAALDLRRYWPEAHQGSIIVTTRSAVVKLGHQIQVKKLNNTHDSLSILEQASGRTLKDDNGAARLATKLDGLPLALATAGAYLSQSTMTFVEYLHYFEKSWEKLHKSQPALMSYADRTLYSTWQISYEQIKQRNSVAALLLHLWGYFDNQDLWFELLEHSSEDLEWAQDLVEDRLSFDECMRVLCDHGLVEISAVNPYAVESRGYSIHTCVHAWMMAVLNAERNDDLARCALGCVASHAPENTQANWSVIERRMLNHANRAVSLMDLYEERDGMAWAYYNIGLLYANQCNFNEASKLYGRALRENARVLGTDHKLTLDIFNRLGMLYGNQGKLGQAEAMCIRALEGREKALGPDHTSTLDTVHNLGNLYQDQGKLKQAEEMYSRALAGCEKALGADHTSTLNTVNNLGVLYKDQGKLGQAQEMYMQALRGKEKALGPDHTSTLNTVNNLGLLYADQGKLEQAEKMYIRALAGYEKALGADHTSTLGTVSNLGILYGRQGKPNQAEGLFLRALRGYEKALGSEHTLTLHSAAALGFLYANQHRMQEAEQLHQRAVASYCKMLPSHQRDVDRLGEILSRARDATKSLSENRSVDSRRRSI